MRLFKKKNKNLNFFELTPFHLYKFKKRDDGLIDVYVPKFSSSFARKYLLKYFKNPFFRANLDEYGSYLWENIDGQKKVANLIDLMKERFGSAIEPATERTLLFFSQLYNAGFIDFLELKKE
ncbi:MAG: PqqD family protein [Candidatus Kapaibacteriales bacterium]